MAWGLPKLPGLTFYDPTKSLHHKKNSLKVYQGYRFSDATVRGIGGTPTDVDSCAYSATEESITYDPSLTYGRVKQAAPPAVVPHWVHYATKCLNFTAFFKQAVFENPNEHYRIRICNMIYFLEDDTMMVMEKKVPNSGIWQGRLVNRGKIPKNDLGDFWHWKDLDNGRDIAIYGKVFHTVSCDLFTQEWLASQGVELSPEEYIPSDPYTDKERLKASNAARQAPAGAAASKKTDDALRRFLQYGGKILKNSQQETNSDSPNKSGGNERKGVKHTAPNQEPDQEALHEHDKFDCVWDDRDSEYGEMREYKILYFLEDDTIAVKEVHDDLGGRDPFPLLLKRMKLPKRWKERPVTFPFVSMEMTDEEITEYYCPSDLVIGETVFVLGRKFLLCDCDKFTRDYFRNVLGMDQPKPIEIPKQGRKEVPRELPPHIPFGEAEDSIQSCFSLLPKPPFKDMVKYTLNANKNLRYLCELDSVHCEDIGRRFVMSYSLADGKIRIGEIKRRNSGIIEGTFLKSMLLPLPDSNPNFPSYYTPDKFYVGAVIPVFKHRFRIIGCDLFVYRYMVANPDKFPKEIIDNVRNYHMREGNLKEELQEACIDEMHLDRHTKLEEMGKSAMVEPSTMEKCLNDLGVEEGKALPPAAQPVLPLSNAIDYADCLNKIREDLSPSQRCTPKGILRSSDKRDGEPKAVCFNAAAPQERFITPQDSSADEQSGTEQADLDRQQRISGAVQAQTPPQPKGPPKKPYDDDPNLCERYRDMERERFRATGECPYPILKDGTEGDDRRKVAAMMAMTKPVDEAIEGFLKRDHGIDCLAAPPERIAPEEVKLTAAGEICQDQKTQFGLPPKKEPPPCCHGYMRHPHVNM